MIDDVFRNWNLQVATSELNRLLAELVAKRPPAAVAGKYVKLNYVTQTGVRPPTFMFFSNFPKLIQKSYIKFIENQFRNRYALEGVPVRIRFKRK
jgi:GTP-binding protein